MWSTVYLCLLATSAIAVPEWKENTEYQYEIQGRTFTGLHEVAQQYSGLLYKAELKVQPRSNKILQARITNAHYSQVHKHLEEGFTTPIPSSELSWKSLDFCSKPFQILMENGEVKGLLVSDDLKDWEENMIKGIVSQFQLKISERFQTEEVRTSSNERTEQGVLSDFTVMEDTVTGETETFYRINKLPEYLTTRNKNLDKIRKQTGSGNIFEVTKHKNYSLSSNLPTSFYGLGGLQSGLPATNKMGSFFTRGSFSRAILTGELDRYTIYNTYTISEILVNPTFIDRQRGSVYSMVNVTLKNVQRHPESIEEVPNPVQLNTLVYSNEFSKENLELTKLQYRSAKLRSPKGSIFRRSFNEEQSNEFYEEDHMMLFRGHNRASEEEKMLVVQNVKRLCIQIAEDSQNAHTMLHKGTMDKFTILNSLVRVLKMEVLKQVADELYDARQASQRDAWKIFRDSVAVSGTEPAMKLIKEWILSSRVSDVEAALVVSSMAKTVRQPSLEYLQSFFELLKEEKVWSEWPLNDTAVLSFSQLVREIYIDDKRSSNQYHSRILKKVRSPEGFEFLKQTIIPHFSQQLDRAIENAQTHKIHVFIQVLGNIAHPQILMAFKPYLEGEKQASQYQRILMVLSLNRLAEMYPEQTRGVLMRLYENVGENPLVRAVCVYQIIRAKPTVEILQYMASYTNVDKHDLVSAAVKSTIETVSRLQSKELLEIRQAAEAAKPLLTKKNFGIQDGAGYIRQHLIEELKMHFTETLESVGSEDQHFPRGIRYAVTYNLAGLKNELVTLQAMVSNIDEVINVFKQQTKKYSEEQSKQKEAYNDQSQHKLSSQYVAEILGLKPEEREQLEGSLYLEHGILQGMLSFDNTTVPRLMKRLEEWEEELEAGKQIQLIKFNSASDVRVHFPTEMGFMFVYTYETPSMIRLHGSIKAASSPKICHGKLQSPESIEIATDLTLTVTLKEQGRLSFLTPFDKERYLSGYDRHVQLHLPIKWRFQWDLNKNQMRAEIDTKTSQEKTRLLHYSTWPYTSRVSYTKFEPVSLQPNTRIIKQEILRSFDEIVGIKHTGLALRVQVEHERSLIDVQLLRELVWKNGFTVGLMSLWNAAEIQYSQFNVTLLENACPTRKIVLNLGFKEKYFPKAYSMQQSELSYRQNTEERLSSVMNMVSSDIKNANSKSYDLSVEFQGDQKIKYVLAGGYARSDVDPKSKAMLKGWKESSVNRGKPYKFSMKLQNFLENTNELNLQYSMKTVPKMQSQMQLSFGEESEEPCKVQLSWQFKRSEERTDYLKKQHAFKQCQLEMREGNHMMPPCQNLTLEYNLQDIVDANVKYENIPREAKEILKTLYYSARLNFYPDTEVDYSRKSERENEIALRGMFDPDLKAFNISIKTPEEMFTMKNIPLSKMSKGIIVPHPVYPVHNRLMAQALGLKNYAPTCVVDQNKISTFMNSVYPADISDKWTVMFQFIPKQARLGDKLDSIRDQLKTQTRNYAVLVKKDSDSNKRQVKVTLSTPETELRVMDITLKPSEKESCRAQVMVNDKEVEVSKEQAYQFGNGFVQIYVIPNGEVKIEVRDQFFIIFDGQRIKLSLLNGMFRDSIRGICGQYTDKKMEDFFTPSNCYMRDDQKFIKSYEVEGSQGREVRNECQSSENPQCLKKNGPAYVSLFKSADEEDVSPQCTKLQTRYIEKGGEICFTLRPMLVCGGNCQPTSTTERNVPVHCIRQSSVSQLWKKQIDNGGSPDFSHKSESRSEAIEIPQSCA